MPNQDEWLLLAKQIGLVVNCRKWMIGNVEMVGVQWISGDWDSIEYAKRCCHPLPELREIVKVKFPVNLLERMEDEDDDEIEF